MDFLFLIISFGASIIGAICGIGGGIIVKPLMDALSSIDVFTINFLSGCTVLSMCCYSIIKSIIAKDSKVNMSLGTPLAIGAAIGGILGKDAFTYVAASFSSANSASAVQAGLLLIVTLGSLLYTLYKAKLPALHISNKAICLLIGMMLGCMSSFLGIGGGPINLVVLYFFFSMGIKDAAQNSLYIILFSQCTSIARTIFTSDISNINIYLLGGMIVCGIFGGIFGRFINKKISEPVVNKLFIIVMIVIIFICMFNIYKFTM